ncbi:MAG: hypothetical protein HYY84_07110 [Deltaproteobacteria bacterium]|nr:hypothetical protein [Deltaproteobacteria bacterium]
MTLPFVDRAPTLELRDELAEVLGALAPGETFRYTYADAVKLAGHSCPTIAGAYLMTAAAIHALYGPGEVPMRGAIEVTLGGTRDDGGTAPMAQVIALITGAAPETGFGGLMGRWRRQNLLTFNERLTPWTQFRRIDHGRAVQVCYDPSAVPPNPEARPLLMSILRNSATSQKKSRFAALWQARVEAILTGDIARVVSVRMV